MKPSLPIFTILATIAALTATEATDPSALIHLKSQIGNLALNVATSVIQAKQNLVKNSAAAIINAKTNFLQRQLPHFVQFKTNQLNSVLELKKNLLKSKVAPISLPTGGSVIQAAEEDVVPYSPPALAPPVVEEPQTAYSPLPPLEPPPPPAAPPVEEPLLPYPPPSPLAKRQLSSRQEQPVKSANAPSFFRPQRTPSHESRYEYNRVQYSVYPTPPPQPPFRSILYV